MTIICHSLSPPLAVLLQNELFLTNFECGTSVCVFGSSPPELILILVNRQTAVLKHKQLVCRCSKLGLLKLTP